MKKDLHIQITIGKDWVKTKYPEWKEGDCKFISFVVPESDDDLSEYGEAFINHLKRHRKLLYG